jgi:hypothetical protein
MNNKFKLIQKYNKEMSEMLNIASKLVECNKKNCKKKLDELENYKKKILQEISVLIEKEKTTISYKDFQSNLQKLTDDYRNKKVVILFLDNIKKNVKNDTKTTKNYTKEFKIYQKKVKKNLKMYIKTQEKKYYINETNKLLNKMIDSKENINLLKCSYEKCLELQKKDLIMVKNFTEKLCIEKKKKSCKIYKMIDNLDLTKITYKDTNKIIKLIKKGLF